MKPKFSVIIPHYNNVDSIYKLIGSIPKSDNIEVIIVDDATPNARVELNALNEDCTIHFCENNIGAGACRNIGLSYVNSDWVIFADSDDYFSENAFDIFDYYSSSSSDIIFFNVDSVDLGTNNKNNRCVSVNNLVNNLIDENCNDIRYSSAVPWGKMIKNQLISDNDIKFDEVICSNDAFFSLKVGHLAREIEGSKDIVYIVTRRSGSLTTTKTDEYIRTRFKVSLCMNKYLYIIRKKEYQTSLIKLILSYRRVISFSDWKSLIKDVCFLKQKIMPRNLLSGKKIFKIRDVYNNVK